MLHFTGAMPTPKQSRHSARVLVVDSDKKSRTAQVRCFEGAGLTVTATSDGECIRDSLNLSAFDLITVDVSMPEKMWQDVIRDIRNCSRVPVVVVANRSDTPRVAVAYGMGIDGDLTRPVAGALLIAVAQKFLDRSTVAPPLGFHEAPAATPAPKLRRYEFDGWEVDFALREATQPNGERRDLTDQNFNLLALFVAKPIEIVSRARIEEHMAHFEEPEAKGKRYPDVCISRLRERIDLAPGNPSLIKTHRGRGYSFTPKKFRGPY